MNQHNYGNHDESNLRPRRPSSMDRQPYVQRQHNPQFEPRPHVPVEVLDRATVTIEKKNYTVLRCKNLQGEYLRIEETHIRTGRENAIIIPASGAVEFSNLFRSVAGLPVT